MKFLALSALLALPTIAMAATRQITLVNYETDGVKQWLPGTIIAKKGDTVELTLINNVPSGVHGFFIGEFSPQRPLLRGGRSPTGRSRRHVRQGA